MADSNEQQQRGLVITRHGQNLLIEDRLSGKNIHAMVRRSVGDLVCGDHVVWQYTADDEGVITERERRQSTLSRRDYSGREKPLAANLTQLIVVIAPLPEPTGYLLDQYLVAAELMDIKALIVINKADLLDADEKEAFLDRFRYYSEINYPLIYTSTKDVPGTDELRRHLSDEVNILVGQSGVGKSSLINDMIPDLDLRIGKLSQATDLGKHTTSSTSLYHLPQGGDIIDSPGVRSFRLGSYTKEELESGFPEFRPYLGKCRFNNCSHTAEPDCAIIENLNKGKITSQRLDAYHQLLTQAER